jgi:hypothetical protein
MSSYKLSVSLKCPIVINTKEISTSQMLCLIEGSPKQPEKIQRYQQV